MSKFNFIFMKKSLLVLVVLMITSLSYAQDAIKGVVVDASTKEPLIGVSIYCTDLKRGISTELDGSFALKLPKGQHELVLSYVGYTTQNVKAQSGANLGEIALQTQAIGLNDVTVTSSVAIRRKTPVALSVVDPVIIENKLGTQEFPEILKSTPGIYATKQGGGFGDSRVNVRGFEAANTAVMINGVPMNDMEWGGIYWSNWGALSDVTRSMQVQRGLGASKVAAPSLGGSINVVTRSTDMERGGSVSYGIGNDGYSKMGFSVSTGLTPGKWAITLMGSKATGTGYIQGTEFQSYSYFINISKRINDSHQLSLTAFAAPQWHNQRNVNDKLLISEWEKQPLKYQYNASYGFDMNGQRKVSSYNYYNKPQISLNHFWTINDKSSLSTALYMSIGRGGGWSGQGYTSTDRSNWYGSSNGVPTTAFRSADGTFDYGAIYALNKASEVGSKMVMSSAINNHMWYGLLSTYTTRIGKYIDMYGGLDLRYYKGTHTNKITDLYGGSFFIDATSLRPLLSDQSWMTRKLKVGDVVYRDYDSFVTNEGLFGQAEYNKDGLSAFVAVSGSSNSNWRYDRFYYDAANARSKTISFWGYSVKGGANYNLNAYHNVFANIGYISRAPFFSGGAFLQSTTSNQTNPNAVNEKAFSAEVGYGFKSRYFSANINLYRTNWIDKTIVRAINANSQNSLVVNMQGVNALHQGVELDFVAKPLRDLELTGMFSLGDWHWQKNASGYLYNSQGQPVDKNGNVVEMLSASHAKVDVNLAGIKVGNSAQTTGAAGVSYYIVKGFKLGLDGNYYGRNYSYYNISSVGTSLSSTTFAQPWRIPDYVTFDFFGSYRFKMGDYDATLTGNVENLFNRTYISDATDGSDHTWKTATVFYGFGRTWSVNLKVRF
ncbi:MAG: TonB-dependent receptor plug [Bacteroidetes bacterium]|nr:TonB-dependent receptor plug [Bacteroidota bacterium]